MEEIDDNKPTNWIFTNPNGISSITSQGRVHTGSWSVNIEDQSAIEQTIPIMNCGCFYRLGFFARGEGSEVGLNVTATYETTTGPIEAGSMVIRKQEIANSNRNFTFYNLITNSSPSNVTGIKIKFLVNADGNQSLDLDDVSLTVI